MTFATLSFIILFLPITVLVGKLINRRFLLFWVTMAGMVYIGILNIMLLIAVFSLTLFSYLCSILFHRWSKATAVVGIIGVVLLSLFFRVIIVDVYRTVLAGYNAALINFTTCVALSTCTLSQIGYLIDRQRNDTMQLPSFFRYMAYSFYMPMLFVGPIYSYDEFTEIWKSKPRTPKILKTVSVYLKGVVKLSVLASSLLLLWYEVCTLSSTEMTLATGIIGIVSISMAVYYILMGYSDICKSMSEMFGIPMEYNQNRFFACRTFSGFVSRFNLSVSRWTSKYLISGKNLGGSESVMISWMVLALFYLVGSAALTWGLILTILNIFERKIILPMLGNSRRITPFYTIPLISFGFVFFGFFTIGSVSEYLVSMFASASGGIYNSFTLHIISGNWTVLLFGWILLSSFAKRIYRKLSKTRMHRLADILFVIIIAVLLVASIACLIDVNNNPMILFGGGVF